MKKIIYKVRMDEDTVWLTQQQMTELFSTSKQNISLHVNNIFKEEELEEKSVVKDSLTTARFSVKCGVQWIPELQDNSHFSFPTIT